MRRHKKITIKLSPKGTIPYDDTAIWEEVNKKLDREDISDWALSDEKPEYNYSELNEKPNNWQSIMGAD